ncbi:hypothetical protein U27_00858 [Candidatus Vecturithrix granuli]|uniref:HNH endonuclease 5 domain-containing protein n=1 Tax=Vecturithrix granuli TaxID=1499967 RepID=A0A081C8Q5_VECG1|nr:hypothetical protein U27_00858 [Candidatus Vecturithrix granuli]
MSKIERCFGCTKEFTKENPSTLDHLIPQAIGGSLKCHFVRSVTRKKYTQSMLL